MQLSRRMIIVLSTITAATTSMLWQMFPSYGMPPFIPGDERYLPNPKLPAISYERARANIDAAIKLEIDGSQRDFDIVFTDAKKDQIRARIWNATQLALNQYYRPEEAN